MTTCSQKPHLGSVLDLGNIINTRLAGRWLMNEGSGSKLCDLSNHIRNGIVSGAQWAHGRYGPCLYFDGVSDYVTLCPNSAVAGAPGFTASLWFQNDLTDNSAGDVVLLADNSGPSYSCRLYWRANELIYYYGQTETASATTTTGTTITDTNWHHLVAVYDGAYISLYVDGVLRGTPAALTGVLKAVSSNFVLSKNAATLGWTGRLDLPILYTRALTPQEIKHLYINPFAGIRPPRMLELWSALLGGDQTIDIDVLNLSLAIQSPVVSLSPSVFADVQTLTLAEHDPSVYVGIEVNVETQQLTLTIPNPTVSYDYAQSVAVLALTLAQYSPGMQLDMSVEAESQQLTLTMHDPTESCDMTVFANALQAVLNQGTVDVRYDMTVFANVLQAVLNQGTVDVRYDTTVVVGAALALLLNVTDPTVETSTAVTINVTAQGLVLTLNQPSVSCNFTQVVERLQLIASLHEPSQSYDMTVQVGSALALLLGLQNPSTSSGIIIHSTAQGLTIAVNDPNVCYDYSQMVSAMNLIANLPGVDVAYDYEIETAMQQLTMGLHDPTIEIGTGFLAAWFLAMKRRR